MIVSDWVGNLMDLTMGLGFLDGRAKECIPLADSLELLIDPLVDNLFFSVERFCFQHL